MLPYIDQLTSRARLQEIVIKQFNNFLSLVY